VIRASALGRRAVTPVWPFVAATVAMLWAVRAIGLKGLSGLAEVGAAVVAPIAGWIAWSRPLLFPYGFYALLAPLDSLTQLSAREGTITRIIGAVAGAALLLYAVRTRSLCPPPRAILWAALLCGWIALSTLWSVGEHPNLEATTMLQLVVLYLIVATFPTRKRDVVPLLGAILAGGLIAAAIGIYEFHAGGVRETQSLQDFSRVAIVIGRDRVDPNMYGDSLLLPFAISLAWFTRSGKFLAMAAAFAAMTVLLIAVALAGSRDAAIGVAIEAVVLTVLLRAWRKTLLPILAMGAAVMASFPNVIERVIEDSGNGGSGRTSIWRVGLAGFLHHPIVGAGSGSYATIYDQWYLRVFERVDPGWDLASHDIILHYGVEFGAIGLALLIGWCLAQWFLARALPRTGLLGDARAICLAALAAFAFVAFFIDVFDAKFVWLAFGLVAQVRSVALFEGGG
jgi:O-antigen ligase